MDKLKAALLALFMAGASVAAAHADAPTWYKDVLPIVTANCVDCHQPQGKNMGGMVAPFSLLSYDDARTLACASVRECHPTARPIPAGSPPAPARRSPPRQPQPPRSNPGRCLGIAGVRHPDLGGRGQI